jgi:hypothetical protein
MVLRALIDESDDPVLREPAKALVHRRRAPPFKVCHIAVGEAFAGIARKRKATHIDPMWKFEQLLHRSESLEIVGIPRDLGEAYHRCALRLHCAEAWLDPNDACILGIALVDPECSVFYTKDRLMVESGRIRKVAREYGATVVGI